ncbi:MAG: hypothetical protein AB7K04_00860 [Pseudorhodoplanes sp.]
MPEAGFGLAVATRAGFGLLCVADAEGFAGGCAAGLACANAAPDNAIEAATVSAADEICDMDSLLNTAKTPTQRKVRLRNGADRLPTAGKKA